MAVTTPSSPFARRRRNLNPAARWLALYGDDAEMLVKAGRVVTALFVLFAIYLDPTQPSNFVQQAYAILIAYVLFALLKLCTRLLQGMGDLACTLVDTLMIGLLVEVTGELESPVFALYSYALISTALRWRWRGILAVATALQGILIVAALTTAPDGDPETNFLILRSVSVWLTVIMLGYFATHRDRSNARLRELASWPHDILVEENRPWFASSLRHAASVLSARQIVVIWRDQDKAETHMAMSSDAGMRFEDAPAIVDDTLFNDALGRTLKIVHGRRRRLIDALISTEWNAAFVTGFVSIRYRGAIVVIDPAVTDQDAMLLMRIVASRIAMELEQFALIQEHVSTAAIKERMRVARNLHDSVLQDLTAAILQIDAAERALHGAPRETLARTSDVLRQRQRSIRRHVAGTPSMPDCHHHLADQLNLFAHPLRAQWDCNLSLKVDPPDLTLREPVLAELCLMISEATANAARHGAATAVDIAVTGRGHLVDVMIRDNGNGGRRDTLPRPRSLESRVSDLGGRMDVTATDGALRVHLQIPTAECVG